ncbi:MAG: MFS transporter [bacterium]|nr:MFS transporter [bacterium]
MKNNKITFVLLYIFGFFWALSSALPAYIQSSYLEQFVGVGSVGLYITAATFITLLAIFVYPRIIKKFTNYTTAVFFITLLLLTTLGLSAVADKWLILIFFIFNFLSINLIFINVDVFLENISDTAHTGRIRTKFLTVINIAWFLSPLITGSITGQNAYSFVYLASALILLPALLIIFIQKRKFQDHNKYQSRHFHQLLKVFKYDKNLAKIFKVSFILQFFYCVMVLYVPLYLHENFGFSWQDLGYMFTIMLLPFVIFQLPAGSLADRYFGEKEILTIGLIIMMTATGAIFFINSTSFLVWAAVLFMTRVGAALVEAMQDVYFFKIVNRQDMDLINLFRDLRPAAWLAGSLFSVGVLYLLPVQYLFLFLAVIVFISLRPALSLKDTK